MLLFYVWLAPLLLVLLLLALYLAPIHTTIALISYTALTRILHTETNTGSPWLSFSQHWFVIRQAREALGLALVPRAESTVRGQVLFAVHPHGVCSDYRLLMDGMIPKTFPEISPIRVLAASILFRIPFVREVALWTSCVSASRASAELCLKKKLSILVIPGGEREQLATEYQRDKVFLKKRLGFIRLALKYQVPIIPTYVFGCVDLYKTSSFAFRFREWLVENLGICIPIFWGEYGTIQPFLVPQTIVFGNPLFLKSLDTDEPSKEQVQQGLELYIEALKALFEENKHEYGYGDRELVIE